MVCLNCLWEGDVWELAPLPGEEYGNELCPECGSMDVVDSSELGEFVLRKQAKMFDAKATTA